MLETAREVAALCLPQDRLDAYAGIEEAYASSVGHFPLNQSIAPDGKTAVVDTPADGAVAVVDFSKLKIVRIIKTDEWPHGIAVF